MWFCNASHTRGHLLPTCWRKVIKENVSLELEFCGSYQFGLYFFSHFRLSLLFLPLPLFCSGRHDDWCFLCELERHVVRCGQSSQPFSPINILSRLPNIGGNLGYGRQEDAHEFMRFILLTISSLCYNYFASISNFRW